MHYSNNLINNNKNCVLTVYDLFDESFNDNNNLLLGLNARYNICKSAIAYSQFVVDDIDFSQISKKSIRNKFGFQLGLKFWNAFSLKNLFLQTDYQKNGRWFGSTVRF